jgi:hypothetical protein
LSTSSSAISATTSPRFATCSQTCVYLYLISRILNSTDLPLLFSQNLHRLEKARVSHRGPVALQRMIPELTSFRPIICRSGASARPRRLPSSSSATPSATRWACTERPTCRGLRTSSHRSRRGARSGRPARLARRQCTTSTRSPSCASQSRPPSRLPALFLLTPIQHTTLQRPARPDGPQRRVGLCPRPATAARNLPDAGTARLARAPEAERHGPLARREYQPAARERPAAALRPARDAAEPQGAPGRKASLLDRGKALTFACSALLAQSWHIRLHVLPVLATAYFRGLPMVDGETSNRLTEVRLQPALLELQR